MWTLDITQPTHAKGSGEKTHFLRDVSNSDVAPVLQNGPYICVMTSDVMQIVGSLAALSLFCNFVIFA